MAMIYNPRTTSGVTFVLGSGGTDSTADVRYLSGEIDLNSSDITYLSGEIDNNSADITYLSGEIDDNSSDITYLSGEIDDNSSDITYISGVVDDMLPEPAPSGQILFWTGNEWINTLMSELVWDDENKRLGVGNATPLAPLHSQLILTTGNGYAGYFSAIANNSAVGSITAGYASATIQSTPGGGASADNVVGMFIRAQASAENAATSATNMYGAQINTTKTTVVGGTVNVTNAYGLFISDVDAGDTLNYAIYTAGGTNYFEDIIDRPGIYGGIHMHDSSAGGQTIPASSGYTIIDGFSDPDFCNNVTADAANNKITFTETGLYKVTWDVSFASGKANVLWKAVVFLEGVEQDQAHWMRSTSNANDFGSAACAGFLNITTVPQDVDVRINHDDDGNVDFTMTYSNLNVEYKGRAQ